LPDAVVTTRIKRGRFRRVDSLLPAASRLFDKARRANLDRLPALRWLVQGLYPLALFRILAVAAMLCVVLVLPTVAQERVALVVGNSAYQHIPSLRNPKNDAGDLTARLEGLGFTVFGGTDLDRPALVQSLIRFGRAAEKAEVALFFYAGHGLQVNGQNYLVPVDAMVEFESEIDLSLVSLSGVMQQLERGSRTNIVFLDACRDNPFEKQLAQSSNRSAMSLNKGLGRIQSGSGTFIAFATQPDAVAADGTGRNSPFTTALLDHIGTPGQSISDMMIEVRNDVLDATNGQQVPWDSSSLRGRFAFVPDAPVATAEPAPSVKQPEPAEPQEAAPTIAMVTRSAEKPRGTCSAGPGGVSYCATSVLPPQGKNSYGPATLFDGKPATAWVENHPDSGLGETITLDFGRERLVTGFDILNGYSKDDRTWSNNSRVRGAIITLSDGRSFGIELPDARDMNRFEFSRPINTASIAIRIESVYRGTKYADTAISELYPVFAD